MYYPAEMILYYYIPESIEPGMYFITRGYSGEKLLPIYLWEVTSSMKLDDPLEEIFNKLGYPVKLFIIDPIDHSILASQEQIGWFDEGEESDEYRDITLKDINNILENEGLIEIEIDEKDDIVNVILEEGKIIIRVV